MEIFLCYIEFCVRHFWIFFGGLLFFTLQMLLVGGGTYSVELVVSWYLLLVRGGVYAIESVNEVSVGGGRW